MYFLWWMSVITIFYEDGYHPEQDNVWVISFTAVLLALWFLKKWLVKTLKYYFLKTSIICIKVFNYFCITECFIDVVLYFFSNFWMMRKKVKTLYFFLMWVFGFFVLLSFDLFMEGIVFELLEWNGTTKNDWFFVLWWGFVVVWFLYGIIMLYRKINLVKD